MLRGILIMVLVASMIATSSSAQLFDQCDNVIDIENGEKGGPPFLGIAMVMGAHALAERHCGAQPSTLRRTWHDYVLRRGCDEQTVIYEEIEEQISFFESAPLAEIIGSGASETEAEIDLNGVVAELGGYGTLLDLHRQISEAGLD